MFKKLSLVALSAIVISCSSPSPNSSTKADFSVDYEKFELDNGLDVVFHVDRSDPVVAVALTAHVGSAREKEGRTGFAHLFEHLLFLESENLGKGGLDKLSARVGGSGANGSTSRDRTNYFQTVPNDALEKMIWAEADKLGWFINTVTDPVLAKEKQVVKNEKRQGVDNRPYGHTSYVIDKNLYPADHPYNWQVIGSLEDLQNATLADVKEFFNRWYVPNNVTLVVSGDFDVDQAKTLVKKYFDEIPRGEEVAPLSPRPGVVENTIKLYHEDNFARLPELTLTWPTVEQYQADAYALDVLTQYLASGKKAPFYQVLVEDKKLTSRVSMYNRTSELAGQLHLSVRAYTDTDLDDVQAAIGDAFAKFEAEGISQKDLDRIKAGQETGFYNSLSSVLGKGFQLAQYNIFANDPGYIQKDIEQILAVSTDDVMRVYNKYIKGKNYIATSFVPQGQLALALEGSNKAEVVEEAIVQGAEETFDASIQAEYERTPSSFDRTVEPPYGNAPEITVPEVYETSLSNGLKVYGIENDEVPLVQLNLVIDGGQLVESMDQLGVANLTADLMTKGTANKTPEELEEAIEQLGAHINIFATKENIRVSANTLTKNYAATLDLIEEMLLEPRWDEKEFELAKQSTISQIRQQEANPNAIAANAYQILIYGKDDIRAQNTLGTMETVEQLTIADLKNYYANYISPSVAKLHVVGDISESDLVASLSELNAEWEAKAVQLPELSQPAAPSESKVYFYDVPNAKQSVLNIGYGAMPATDEDYYPATVMNYILGGGGFASQLTQELREGKGYTYGIRSNFSGNKADGTFTISSGVRTNVTLESTALVKEILADYGKNYSDQDLATTKGYLIKSNARAFETAGAKLSMLENISEFGWSPDYVKDREAIVRDMTVEEIQALSKKYLDPNKMIWLVVGDAKTQKARLKQLGFGEPVLINDMTGPEK
ncbi:M16 family metallopeptidase [Roseivirga pacifica]|uniref:M16 family metallopeptidase n=1 Tax=Roseivirga pacifica TaxID=1267423 RepID=UPI0020948970|nr:pitrilysin family protein [Roseivirga pacifica]MCO6360379.1 insulinase family protein [Roseivirga pacifica]MCO6368268.1 insulinase family protein [Roseivirga pacifica]MCO6372410.1 insulinase family protein [Roseivirga pacifica]MCO6376468.1 insulinase family protein [Roseivirga pacifica]MCO6378252.1 insulinase family protein [Roseivirga pacifica]